MNKHHLKIITLLLLLIFLSVVLINVILNSKIEENRESEIITLLKRETDYLQNSFKANLSQSELLALLESKEIFSEKEFITFIPEMACVTCVDKFLHILLEYKLDDKVHIIVSSESQLPFFVEFNDIFSSNFQVVQKNFYTGSSDILILRGLSFDNQLILIFRLGDEVFFKEYFERFLLNRS